MFNFDNYAYAYGKPLASGCIKTFPEDFKVDELLGFDLAGEREHLFLLIEKKGLNTEEVVKALARTLGKSEKLISCAGLKDRQAVTTQWISIHCPGEHIADAELMHGPGWRVLAHNRHLKKLKTGALAANNFTLTIREITDVSAVEERLQQIQTHGVPNYFGPQRFGYSGNNLIKAEQVLLHNLKIKNHFLRGIYYSAARAFLFNLVLSERVKLASWNKAIAGDVLQLSGSNSIFTVDAIDAVIEQRVSEFDISPAAVLWGRGEERASGQALLLQETILEPFKSWCTALEQHKLERSYRAQRLAVQDLKWEWQENTLMMRFQLTPGSYATSVVRELVLLEDNAG